MRLVALCLTSIIIKLVHSAPSCEKSEGALSGNCADRGFFVISDEPAIFLRVDVDPIIANKTFVLKLFIGGAELIYRVTAAHDELFISFLSDAYVSQNSAVNFELHSSGFATEFKFLTEEGLNARISLLQGAHFSPIEIPATAAAASTFHNRIYILSILLILLFAVIAGCMLYKRRKPKVPATKKVTCNLPPDFGFSGNIVTSTPTTSGANQVRLPSPIPSPDVFSNGPNNSRGIYSTHIEENCALYRTSSPLFIATK